jgi:hypothetical protein
MLGGGEGSGGGRVGASSCRDDVAGVDWWFCGC